MGIISRSGVSGGVGALLFDSTLGAPAASIDTGANGIALTQNVLDIYLLLRTDDAAALGSVAITLNNDAGANYDHQLIVDTNVTVGAGQTLAANAWTIYAHGAGGSASTPTAYLLSIPGYAQATFQKMCFGVYGSTDATAANNTARESILGYRSTTAISRFKVAAAGGAANLVTGSRVLILGR